MRETLIKVQNNQLSVKKAYEKLYRIRKIKYAKFVKVKMHINKSKGLNILFKFLLTIPIPTTIINKIVKRKFKLNLKLNQLLIKGSEVNILLNDEINIKIKGL